MAEALTQNTVSFYDASDNLIVTGGIMGLGQGYIGRTVNGSVVARVELYVTDEDRRDGRRNDRALEFSETLDILNPIWYDTLLPAQQEELKAWRLLWLDYPDDLTATRPVIPPGIFT